MKKLATICALILFTVPAIGLAQIQNSLGIGPRLGYYKGKDANEGNVYFGVEARARLGKVLGIEGAVDYRTSQTYDVGNYSANVRQVPITVSALLYLPISAHFEPYGIAGLGAYYTIVDYNSNAENLPAVSDDHSVHFGYHLGFGLSVPFTQNVALNADYRYIFLDPGSDTFGDVGDADFSGNVFTAGLMFYL